MGWSYARAAGKTMDLWQNACRKNCGSQNKWQEANGKTYFFENSRIEHPDGAITGSIYLIHQMGDRCHRVGSFRIEPNGRISRAPKFLRDAVSR